MAEKLPEKELARVITWLSEKMRCPLCGFRYNLERIKLLPNNTGPISNVLLHTNCGDCNSALLFALDVRGGEVFLVGVVTDLTHQDAFKFERAAPLTADDVLAWHDFWQACPGDIAAALSEAGG